MNKASSANANSAGKRRAAIGGEVRSIVNNGHGLMETIQDIDPEETSEWLDSLEAVIDAEGVDRAHFLLEHLITKVRSRG